MKGRVLVAAGSDSGGGAGIQADIKTVTALGGYAATAITALTAQNTLAVVDVHPVPAAFIALQMRVVLEDIGADAIKTGMLGDAAVIRTIAEILQTLATQVPVVVDPVMVAKSGHFLLAPEAVDSVKAELLPLAAVVTPNLPEATALTGIEITDPDDMRRAGEALMSLGPRAVLVKGGHLPGEEVVDVLITPQEERIYRSPRLSSRSTHGTGCTLASAIATGLAQGFDLDHAVRRGRTYLAEAIRSAPGLGHGHGPLNHGHTVRPAEV